MENKEKKPELFKLDMKTGQDEDVVVLALKEKYFLLIKTEEIGKTPGVSKQLDNLERAIKDLIKPEKLYNI